MSDRAETIAIALLWLAGLLLFAWSWQESGSLVAALIVTLVGGFLVVLFAGPLVAIAAFLIDVILPRSRP